MSDEQWQERIRRCEHVSQLNEQWHGQKGLMRWHASSKMASIYFISLVAYGINRVFMVVGTFIFPVQHLGLGRNVALMAAFLLSVTTLMRN